MARKRGKTAKPATRGVAYLERKIRILQRKLLENRKRSSGLTVAHKILRDARKLEELERRTRPGHSDR